MGFQKGNKLGKGRPKKADEEKANTIMLRALKEVYSKETDDEAKVEFIKTTLLDSQRGQLFVAEHIFGKPKETIETTHTLSDFDIKSIFKVDKDK
tara:strand:- start:21658 stop:21942 length:285 start_codon:yes stop_codon:yes gene_type:complete